MRVGERRRNGLEYSLDLFENLMVSKPKHAEAVVFEIPGAAHVCGDGLITSMLTSVELDDQLPTEAAEIRDVRTERHLAPEVRVSKRHRCAEMAPKLAFGVSCMPPQRSPPIAR